MNGDEPGLSGAQFGISSTGHEPMLGGERMLSQLRTHHLNLLHKSLTTHLRRLKIGWWLAEHGDPRPGVGLREDGLPDIVWQAVGPGVAYISDRQGVDERFDVGRFWLARYPITWAQYRVFLEEAHDDPQWWAGLRRREEYPRSSTLRDNHPAQEVSWYDAVAYTRWYFARTGVRVRLPTEWEWQHAANASDTLNVYPWGRDWRVNHANTRESRLRQVTAVGMYPQAVSPFGLYDMCGTVQEWCINHYADPAKTDLTTDDALRVTRGGSWFTVREYAHTTFRTGYDPYKRYNSIGFRLACDDPHPIALPAPDDTHPDEDPPTHD
jgi:hypothetical protein